MDSWTIKGWSRDGMDGKKQRGWIRGFLIFLDIISQPLKVLLSKVVDICNTCCHTTGTGIDQHLPRRHTK